MSGGRGMIIREAQLLFLGLRGYIPWFVLLIAPVGAMREVVAERNEAEGEMK